MTLKRVVPPQGRRPAAVPPAAVPAWSADFGPHICAYCYGAGWMVDRAGDGALHRCTACETVANTRLAMCWKVSGLRPDRPTVPTLKAFEPRSPEARAALAAATAFVRQPHGWLTLHGGPGTGKSHLGEAIARGLLARRVPAILLSSSALWEYLGAVGRSDQDDTDFGGRFRHLAEVEALIIDELNIERSSDAVFKLRRGLLDARYRAALDGIGTGATVLISNDAPERWQDGAIADRALDRRFVTVHTGTESYRRIAP